jgi:hypothetical protein
MDAHTAALMERVGDGILAAAEAEVAMNSTCVVFSAIVVIILPMITFSPVLILSPEPYHYTYFE